MVGSIKKVLSHPFFYACLILFNSPEEFQSENLFLALIFTIFYSENKNKFYPYLQFAALAPLTYYIIKDYGTLFTLDASTNYLGILFGLKCLDQKKYSYQGFLIIGLALNAAFCLYDQSLTATLLLFLSFLYFVFLLFQKQNEKIQIKFQFHFLKKFRFYLYTLFTVVITSLFFFIFPRIAVNFSANSSFVSQSGFSPSAKPGQVAELKLSNNSIFSVQFNQNPPPLPKMYWIGSVLTETDGYFWEEDKNNIVAGFKNHPSIEDRNKRITEYDIQIQSQTSQYLFNLDSPIKPPEANFPYFNQSNKSFSRYQLTSDKIRYRGFSLIDIKTNKGRQKIKFKNRYLKASNKVKELALSLKKNSPEETLSSIQNWFVSQGFVYSLSPGRTEQLDDFLLGSKRGFCTHYASAVAMLLRYANYSSRVITGFHGGEYNDSGDFYMIKGKDAHAWIEYLNSQNQWVRIDPVQWIRPDRIQLGGQRFFALSPNGETQIDPNEIEPSSILIEVQKYFDLINLRWQSLMYSYDRDGQREFAKKLGLKTKQFFVYGISLIAFVFILLIFYIIQKTRRRGIEDLLILLEKTLNKNGHSRLSQESFRKFIIRIGDQCTIPNQKEIIHIFSNQYENYFFKSKIIIEQNEFKQNILDVIKVIKRGK